MASKKKMALLCDRIDELANFTDVTVFPEDHMVATQAQKWITAPFTFKGFEITLVWKKIVLLFDKLDK